MDIFFFTDRMPEPGATLIGNRYWMGMGVRGPIRQSVRGGWVRR